MSLRGGSTPPDGGGDAPPTTPFQTSPDINAVEAPIYPPIAVVSESESETVASTPQPATVRATVERVKTTAPPAEVTATTTTTTTSPPY